MQACSFPNFTWILHSAWDLQNLKLAPFRIQVWLQMNSYEVGHREVMHCGSKAQGRLFWGGALGYQNPKTRKKIGTKLKSRMTLVSTTFFKNFTLWFPLWGLKPENQHIFTTIPEIRARKMADPVARLIYLTRKPAHFFGKTQKPERNRPNPQPVNSQSLPSFYTLSFLISNFTFVKPSKLLKILDISALKVA